MKLIIFLTFYLLTHSAYALTQTEMCNQLNEMAKVFMEERQSGRVMADLINVIEQDEVATERGKKLLKDMIIDAYQRPMYSSKELKEREVVDFQNRWYMQCLKADIK